jgi:dihydroorotase
MPLERIIAATTSAPAQAMGLGERFGRLLPGRQADVSLLRIEPGAWELTDALGETRVARERLAPVQVFKRGRAARLRCRHPNASRRGFNHA